MGGPGLVDGEYVDATDNFLPCRFEIGGIEYYSSENYFQCVKCTDQTEFERVRQSGSGADVWMAGSRVKLRPDWEIVKVRKMYDGNKAKFEQNETLRKQLLATKGSVSFHGSTAFWCKWNARIIELIREELRGEDGDKEKIKHIWELIEEYEKEQGKKD